MTTLMSDTTPWVDICHLDDLLPERGAAALIHGQQVAVFRLVTGEVLAVQNEDPFCGSNVLARGLVGSRGDIVTLASPMYKQVFDLRSGRCLEPMGAPLAHLQVWPARVTEDGRVMIGTNPGAPWAMSGSGT